jgi:tetratricopeptide (TPR) repeat protein
MIASHKTRNRSRCITILSISSLIITFHILIVFAVLCMPAIGMTANDWIEKGNAFFYQNKYNGAIKAYDKAIEINPRLAGAWNNKGLALEDIGKYDEAIKTLDKAIEINPQDADAWSNKGHALLILGKYAEAIKAFDKAIEINPQDTRARNDKSTINTIMLLNALIEPPIIPDHLIYNEDTVFDN